MDAHPLAAGILDNPQTLLLIGLVMILGALLWHNTRRRIKAGRSNRVDGRASQYSDAHNLRRQAQAREDIDELMVRLDELSREICGQIDTRFAKLGAVLDEADRKLARLRRAVSGAAQAGGESEPVDPRHEQIWQMRMDGQSPVEIAAEMNMNVGEVELVLSLERTRRALQGEDAPAQPKDQADDAAGKKPAKRQTKPRIDKQA